MLSRRRRVRFNEEAEGSNHPRFSIFNYPGRGYDRSTIRWLIDEREKHFAETYILVNCPKVKPYFR